MKKIIIISILACIITGCGVGTYSVTSGKADECAISFTATKSFPITVVIDDIEYNIQSVKDKAYKTDRKIKQTAKNTIHVSSGAHDVKVLVQNEIIYSHKIFVSATEHKIIEL